MPKHVVKVPILERDPNSLKMIPTGKFRLFEPGLFRQVTDEEVSSARKLLKGAIAGQGVMDKEAEMKWQRPFIFLAVFALATFAFSGGFAVLFGVGPTSGLWFGGKPLWHDFMHTGGILGDPASSDATVFLFSMMGFLMFAGFLQGRVAVLTKISRAGTAVKRWERGRRKASNDVMIHILTADNKMDPAYSDDPKTGVYVYKGKHLPKGIIKTVQRDGKTLPLDWERFKRDGQFELVIGEEYERDGRFNAHPKLIRIPTPGLYTGLFVQGPTGSGKSQSVLLPIIDQFIGYYSWVEDEKNLWLYDMPLQIQNLEREQTEASSGRKAEISGQIEALKIERLARLKAYAEGKEGFYGYECAFVFVLEPKAEMFADVHEIAKAFGREKHYLELGTVREKYDNYLRFRVQADQAISKMWAYWGVKQNEVDLQRWLEEFCIVNAIPDPEPPAKEGEAVSPKAENHLATSVFGELSALDNGLMNISNQFSSLKRFRQTNGIVYEGASLEENITAFSVAVSSPFCFPVVNPDRTKSLVKDINDVAPSPTEVGPLGFGTANEPWLMRRKVKAGTNNQAIYTDTFSAIVNVYLALGWNFQPAVSDNQEVNEGVFFRKLWGPRLAISDEWGGMFDRLIEIRESESVGSHCDGKDICAANIAMPITNIAGLLYPEAGKSRSAEEKAKNKDAPQTREEKIKEALADLPASKKEAAVLRSVMRSVAPPFKTPGEKKVDFRNRMAFWAVERTRAKNGFIKSLHDGFAGFVGGGKNVNPSTAKNLVDLDNELGETLASQVFRCLADVTPAGMVEAVTLWYLHSPESQKEAADQLVAAGWTVSRPPVEADYPKAGPYDYYVANCMTEPDLEGYREKMDPRREKPEIDLTSYHQRNRKIQELADAALLRGILNRRGSQADGRIRLALYDCTKEVVLKSLDEVGGASGDHLRATIENRKLTMADAASLWAMLDQADTKRGVRYHYDPRVTTGEQNSDAPEDILAMVDTLPCYMRLGPWDGIWSEGIGLNIWEPLRGVVRNAMNKANTLMGEREEELLNDVVGPDVNQINFKRRIMGGYRERRERVNEECLNYLSAVEQYLAILSPLYKCDVPFAYGYSDMGSKGIGNCQGLSKFNPLHSPGQNPNQLAAAMMGVLNRSAGSGDTSFWADAGVLVSENCFSLLRAAFGYVTVSGLFQIVTSDAFADLALATAARRIRMIEAAQSGGDGDENPVTPLLDNIWLKRQRIDNAARKDKGGDYAVPAALGRLLPRVESETELKQLREYLETSSAFITKDWRGTSGSFADAEVKSTVKLNLLQQLTPLTKDIGGYSFSPEFDSISFPTFEEARNAANIIVTRFQQTIDPKLGGLVVGMAKQQYQAMVLGAKGRITLGKIVKKDIAEKLPQMRTELAEVRGQLIEVEQWLAPYMANRYGSEGLVTLNKAIEVVIQGVLAANLNQNDPQALTTAIQEALFAAEMDGTLPGVMTSECNLTIPGSHQNNAGASSGFGRVANAQASSRHGIYAAAEGMMRQGLKKTLGLRDEEAANKKDLRKRYNQRIWRLRQNILNLNSALEELSNNTRLCLFCIDEAQGYVVFSSKGDSISEEKFLGEARAGCSVNVYATQAAAAIKTAASAEQFQYFISNMRTQIVLGCPNEPDQKMISDLWQGEMTVTQGDASFSINYDGVEKDGVTGNVRASKTTGGSKSYSTKEEFKKYVETWELREVPTFRSYASLFDGTNQLKPAMLCHVPYFHINNDKVSPITNEPLCQKPFVSLLRDGEVSLPPMENLDVREMLYGLRQLGGDAAVDIEHRDRMAKAIANDGLESSEGML